MDGDTEVLKLAREGLLALMREWSEDMYCAGWLIDLECRLHREGDIWETRGRAAGWPVGAEARGGWETWDEAAARYASDEWAAERPWMQDATA